MTAAIFVKVTFSVGGTYVNAIELHVTCLHQGLAGEF
jgi:hypothetical protein